MDQVLLHEIIFCLSVFSSSEVLDRLQNSRFRKAGSAVSVILECEARELHTPAGRVRRENDCRLSIQRIRSKEGLYLTIGSCFSVHHRVMEHAGSLESTKEA